MAKARLTMSCRSDASAEVILPLFCSRVIWLSALRRMASILAMFSTMPEVVVVRAGTTRVSVVLYTVTVQLADRPPTAVVQVMTVLPTPRARTVPSAPIVATFVLLLFQVTARLAFAGEMVGTSVVESFCPRKICGLGSEMARGVLASATVSVMLAETVDFFFE